jgi:hypothetical protein
MPLVVIASIFTLARIVYRSNMPWVEPSSEVVKKMDPGPFGSIGFGV